MNKHITNERMRTCGECAHQWVSPVERNAWTRNLSGEVTPPCPQCGSKHIHSGPDRAFQHMEKVSRTVTRAIQNILPDSSVGYQQWANGWASGPHWEIRFRASMLPTFYLHQEQREVEFKTIGVHRRQFVWKWVVNVIVTKTPNNRDEPPYDDSFEVCTHDTAEGALIEAVLSYFRNVMYDSISVVETPPEEAWP